MNSLLLFALLFNCDPTRWDHVYHKERLTILSPCKTVRGTVLAIKREPDGDLHIKLKLERGGTLVVEAICEGKVRQTNARAACLGYVSRLKIPPVGTRISVTGSYVADKKHGNQLEIHPVSSIRALP